MSMPRDERLPVPRILSHLAVMLAVAGVLGLVVAGLAIPFAGVVGIGAKNVAKTMDSLPAELDTGTLAQKSTILDTNGNVIASLYDENRVTVPLKQISRKMVKSIVAIEDYRFYQHGALDLKGTLRALVTNQANSGTVQGGSSITQQLVKLTLVGQAKTDEERAAATDETYARKLRELRYAIAIEQRHSKDWILERYLNTAYFGDGAYGIQSAARHYFNVNARQLNWVQSAMLAGLVKSPNGYDPTNYSDKAAERRNVVLERMAGLSVISQAKATKLEDRPLGLDVQSTDNGCLDSRVPFFCDYVVNYLKADPQLGKTPKERERLLKSGGLTIKTTVDLKMQDAADNSVQAHVYKKDDAIGALAIVEPGTGEVRAIAQSRPMGGDKAEGQSFLDYAVPTQYGDSAGFQAGSTFKAFVLATAVNQGIPLSQTFDSPPVKTFDASKFANCPGAGNFAGSFDIRNSTTNGIKNLYTGTRESVNTFYMQLEQETGVCDPYNLAKAMGIQLTHPAGPAPERIPNFTLGVADVSPLEMAEAYSTFAARGLHCDSRPVTQILDADGNSVKKYDAQCSQVMPQSTADAVSDVLRGVIAPDGFGAALQLDQPAAGKTGTTTGGKSVWFVGYTPQLAAAAMIAGANSAGTQIGLAGQTIGGNYISSASGSGFAGPIWGDAMKVIDDDLPYEDFVKPDPKDVRGVLTQVPSVGGQSISAATTALEKAGFTASYGGTKPSSATKGTVAYTYPSGGSSAPAGSAVTIYESAGQKPDKGKKHHDNGHGNGNGHGDGGRRGDYGR